MLYELLTLGRHPLIRDDEGMRVPHDVMFLRLAGAPVIPLRERVRDVPPELAALVDLGLSRDPAGRPDAVTAVHVLENLARSRAWPLPERPVFSRLQSLVVSKASALELADRTTIEHRPPGSSPVPPVGRVQVVVQQPGGASPLAGTALSSASGYAAARSAPSVGPSGTASLHPASDHPPSSGTLSAHVHPDTAPSAPPPSGLPASSPALAPRSSKPVLPSTALDMSLRTPGPISTSLVLAPKPPFPVLPVAIALVASFAVGFAALRLSKRDAPSAQVSGEPTLRAPALVTVAPEPVTATEAPAPSHARPPRHQEAHVAKAAVSSGVAATNPSGPAATGVQTRAAPAAAPSVAPKAPPSSPPKPDPPKNTQVGPLL